MLLTLFSIFLKNLKKKFFARNLLPNVAIFVENWQHKKRKNTASAQTVHCRAPPPLSRGSVQPPVQEKLRRRRATPAQSWLLLASSTAWLPPLNLSQSYNTSIRQKRGTCDKYYGKTGRNPS